jgi:glycosyltransferase involved in cell wall biosynthesis
MKNLTIFVLCHNRPDFARETLHSILGQTDLNFTLVVSDNSSNDEVGNMVLSEFPQLDYRRREPMLRQLEHFNQCIDETQTDYFCLFHDDDLMHANFVQYMKATLDAHSTVVACGCNALSESLGIIESRTTFQAIGNLEWIASPRDLARRYFARAQSGFAPFPCYVYRRQLVGDVRFLVDGGKYTDATWLLTLAMRGRIVWINTPLMTYRIHGGNDGSIESPRDRLRFMGFIKRNLNTLGLDLLADYRCSFIYKPLVQNVAVSAKRRQLAKAFLDHYSWSRYANPSLYGALIKRALIKRFAK